MTEKTAADLAWEFAQFIDKHGKIINKDSNPVHSILEMEYEKDGVYARFRVRSVAQGNGSFKFQARLGREEVMNADGTFTATPHNVTVEAYKPGAWEKVLS